MSFTLIDRHESSITPNEIDELKSQIFDLKGRLNVSELQLKDNDFKFNKKTENYELQINKLNDENKVLKEKLAKFTDGQRSLEVQNSKLEDRLLKIVEKYETEQKSLFEELTIAHSKLVELKLTIQELEEQKEAYRNDCNVAVNLLQCKPGDFVNHSYNTLPINLKDRLRTILTDEEVLDLEENDELEKLEYEKKNSNTLFKLPVFQPSAAAAMMYNMQNVSMQREMQKQQTIDANETTNQVLIQLSSEQNDASSIHSVESINENPSSEINLKKMNLSLDNLNRTGKVSSSKIAQILKKDLESPSKKAMKLFPYICLRCRKEVLTCDQPTQTDSNDLSQDTSLKCIFPKPPTPKKIIRASTVEANMSSMKDKALKDSSDGRGGIFIL